MRVYKVKPWAHQIKTIDKVLDEKLDYFALFYDVGAGKTKTAVEILRGKCLENNRLLKTLIIGPIAVMHSWKREIVANSTIGEEKIQLLDGTSPANSFDKELKNPTVKRLIEQASNTRPIKIMNTEKIGNANIWDILHKFGFDCVIVDESHKLKDGTAKRTKAFHKFLDVCKIKYRFILTGTPILNSQLDIWAQYYILNPNILGRNFYSFRSQYFYDANASMPSHVHFPDFRIKDAKFYKAMGLDLSESDTIKTLNKIIYDYAHRVMKSEVLDLPPLTYQTLDVPLTTEQAKIYKELEADAVAFFESLQDLDISKIMDSLDDLENLENNIMSADTALVKLIRLQQVIAGDFISDSGEKISIKSNRDNVLKDILEEILFNKENKIIIWSVFKSTYSRIANILDALGVEYTWLTGEQKTKEKQDNMDKFNNDPHCRVIIANQGAGGTGVTLNAANYSVYFTRSYKLEHDLQSEARNYRGGQVRNVTRIDLVSPNTLDEKILKDLAEKKKMADDLLETRKEFTSKDIFNLILKK
jgi:SNF2 family DNA or RNA helicase